MLKLILALSLSAATAEAQNGVLYKTFADKMKAYGYDDSSFEAIKVKTDDGFTLTTFRITGNADGPLKPTKPPVFIQHGMKDDAATFLSAMTDLEFTGLPFHLQLVEAGYDVFIGNNRGAEYSQVHDTLTVDDAEFWAYSW